jgi:hypothetical protein
MRREGVFRCALLMVDELVRALKSWFLLLLREMAPGATSIMDFGKHGEVTRQKKGPTIFFEISGRPNRYSKALLR